MSINARAVVRVIIEGEWIWVERGTFTVIPLEFVDDNGNTMNPSRTPVSAYFFVSTQGDPYLGPLSSISLFKLDNQILEESGSTPTEGGGRPRALGTGTGETFGGEVGPRAQPPADTGDDGSGGADAEGTVDEQPAAKKPVPLFAEDVVDEPEPEPEQEPEPAADAGTEPEPVVEEIEDEDEDEDDGREPFRSTERRRGGLF